MILVRVKSEGSQMNINISTDTRKQAKDLLSEQLACLDTDIAAAVYVTLAERIDDLPEPAFGFCVQVTGRVIIDADIAVRIA